MRCKVFYPIRPCTTCQSTSPCTRCIKCTIYLYTPINRSCCRLEYLQTTSLISWVILCCSCLC
nr:MAG TPA: hypothetical protein [Caudoviricetes sp.]DAN63050.1 MAG TPA: hypothetical protein [Caudoviricetes sp.]